MLVEISTGQHDPGSFSGVHNDLSGRSTTGAHPISAITGLQEALDNAGGGGGGGAVDSVDGRTGAVTLSDLYDAAGAAQAVADTLGTAAAADAGDFATAAQGELADTAVQPADVGSAALYDVGDFEPSGAAAAALSSANTYTDTVVAAMDAVTFRGVIDCSSNPNYPAAELGHLYRVSVAGRIGGGSGPRVEINDQLLCLADGTAAGTAGAVGASWSIIQGNIDGQVIGPTMAVTDGKVALWDGVTGRLLKEGPTLGTAAQSAATDFATAGHNHTGVYDPAGTAAGLVDDLSGVSNPATARTNLGLGTAAVANADAFLSAAAFATYQASIGAHLAAVQFVYVWDGSDYVPANTGVMAFAGPTYPPRLFIGPNDPTGEGFTMADGDMWEDTTL